MLYSVARALQIIGLILLPLALAGNLAELAGAGHALSLKQSLILAGSGVVLFYAGWWLQQRTGSQ